MPKQRDCDVAKKQTRGERMLADLAKGLDHTVIATTNNIGVKTARREIDRALDARGTAASRYVSLQVKRTNRDLHAIGKKLKDGNPGAVNTLIRLLDKLDRYHGLAARAPSGTRKAT